MTFLLKISILIIVTGLIAAFYLAQPLKWRVTDYLDLSSEGPSLPWLVFDEGYSTDYQQVAWFTAYEDLPARVCTHDRRTKAIVCRSVDQIADNGDWRLEQWSPTDDVLVFSSANGNTPTYPSRPQWLYSMRTKAMIPLPLPIDPVPSDDLRNRWNVWNDDATGILYLSVNKHSRLQIYRLTSDRNPFQRVLVMNAVPQDLPRDGAFSADGSQLALLNSTGIAIVDTATGDVRRTIPVSDWKHALPAWVWERMAANGEWINAITWAPDQHTLILSDSSGRSPLATVLADVKTGHVQPLFDLPQESPYTDPYVNPPYPNQGHVSSDGRYFFYTIKTNVETSGYWRYTSTVDWYVISTDPQKRIVQQATNTGRDACYDFKYAVTIEHDHQLTEYIVHADYFCAG